MSNIGLLVFPLSVNDSSIPPSAQDGNLGIIFHFTPSFTPHINLISNTFSFSFRINHSSLQPPLLPWTSYNYYSHKTASKGIFWPSFLGASNSILNTAARLILLKPKSDHATLLKITNQLSTHSDLGQKSRERHYLSPAPIS